MKITYQVSYTLEIDEEDLLGETPEAFLAEAIEEDPASLFENSEIDKFKFLKVTKSEEKSSDSEDEEDDLTVLDEEELNFEE